MAVMIGIDPHNGSHTAVAIGPAEEPLGKQQVRACPGQARQLLAWAQAWPERTWAVEGATGLGRLLAQQLAAAGEHLLDIQPKLAARVRLLQAGDTNKKDPNDAGSVAVAALRSKARRQVAANDHAAVLKILAKRHRDLARPRNQVACRLKRKRRRCGASSGGSATRSMRACAPTPAPRAREGNRGTALSPGRPAPTPGAGSSGQPLPGLRPACASQQRSRRPCRPRRRRTKPGEPLDNDDNKENSICRLLPRMTFVSGVVQTWAICAVRITLASGHLLLVGDFLGCLDGGITMSGASRGIPARR